MKQSTRAQIIERRTYLRPLNKNGTVFETREQAWDRVIEHQHWLWERAKGAPLDDTQIAELDELRTLFMEGKVTVSGRTRWLGGTAIAKAREASQFNPLPRTERFVTDKGVMSFEDVEDGDKVCVLTHTGKWQPATVAYAGERDMLRIHLTRGRTTHTVDSCVDHTWILKDGSRVTARNLAPGTQFHAAPEGDFYDWEFHKAPTDEQLWWCYGFIYGDGSIAKSGSSRTSRVRLCGVKSRFLERFNAFNFGHSFPPSCDADPIVYTGGYLKTLPEAGTEPRMIKAFLRGYLDADGNKKVRRGETRFIGISCSDPEAAEFVETYAPMFGLYVLGSAERAVETNYGLREAREISFTTSSRALLWKVDRVEKAPKQECWCLTVDVDHSFVQPNAIVTGNCSFVTVRTVHDVVDGIWLLLQGCGVGFRAEVGILNGFTNHIDDFEIIRSKKVLTYDEDGQPISDPALKGNPNTTEHFNPETGVWTIRIGDSAEAWAKFFGKLLAFKKRAKKLVVDFSEVRPAGYRLSGYGWISSGDEQIAKAVAGIYKVLNRSAGKLLNAIDILDIMNWLGTILSSRRSAEIALYEYGGPEWEDFAVAKKDHYLSDETKHRSMSNNSLVFYTRPTRRQLKGIFKLMKEAGGSEPGFINGVSALKRAPFFKGVNPCAEILLGDKSFCNLVETALCRFNGDEDALHRAHSLVARANYRQTCVNLRDEVLQSTWHELNEFLRLCGVGVTGVIGWEYVADAEAWRELAAAARDGANGMADELGLPRAQNITTVKPSGTQTKVFGIDGDEIGEGVHKPLGRFIFNNVNFSMNDPIVAICAAAGYKVIENPYDNTGRIVTLPVEFTNVEFDKITKVIGGKDVEVEVNLEPAISQLDRYLMLQENYVDHNCSVTINYDAAEVPEIIDWLLEHWDSYVGVSFIYRTDPTMTAAELGYPYLPQEVVDEATFRAYVATLGPVDLTGTDTGEMVATDDCATGACPIR